MNNEINGLRETLSHLKNGDTKHLCETCGEITWHQLLESRRVIRSENRSKWCRKRRLFGRSYYVHCLRRSVFYLVPYDLYSCERCGNRIRLAGQAKRIPFRKVASYKKEYPLIPGGSVCFKGEEDAER